MISKYLCFHAFLLGFGAGAIALLSSSAAAVSLAEAASLGDVHLALEVDTLTTAAPVVEPLVDIAAPLALDLMPVDSGLGGWGSLETAVEPHPDVPLAQVRSADDGNGWEFVLGPYLFVPFNVQTDISVGGITESVSTGLGDLFSLDRIFSGALRFEARNPQYGFFADLTHVFVQDSRSVSGLPLPPALAAVVNQRTPPGVVVPPGTPVDAGVTITGRTTTFDLGGYYRVVDQFVGRTAANQPTYPRLLVDPYLGLRIARLSSDLNFNLGLGPLGFDNVPVTGSATLIKPLLGAQAGLELSDRWALGLRGNVAGFGIGADENVAWSVLAGARYRMSQRTALQLAYQYKESRYSAGQGISRFSLNQSQQGLLLGVEVRL